MSRLKLSAIVALVVFSVVCAAAIALVIVGVTTHEEAGFANSNARWGRVPLTVACAGYTPADNPACETVGDVVGVLNHRLGFEMLVVGEEPADLAVTMRAPVEVGGDRCDEPGECYVLTGSAGMYTRCEVQTMNVSGVGDLEWLVVYHGLGHCMGLAHDDVGLGSNNIMKPIQRPTPDGVIPPWISDSDRALLRERYGAEVKP